MGYHLMQKPPIVVTVDMTALTQAWIAGLAQSTYSEGETQERLSQRVNALENIMTSLGKDNNWLILAKPSVLQGAPDITGLLAEKVEEKVHEQ